MLLLVHVAAGWGRRRRRQEEVQVEEQEEEDEEEEGEQERGEDLAPGCSTARPPPQVPTFTNTTKGGIKPDAHRYQRRQIFTRTDQDLR